MKQNPLPKIDFPTFILSVASAAFMGLGLKEGTPVDLALAKQNIDLLELMEVKSKGNLTPEESQLLTQILMETRMRYVEVSKQAGAKS